MLHSVENNVNPLLVTLTGLVKVREIASAFLLTWKLHLSFSTAGEH